MRKTSEVTDTSFPYNSSTVCCLCTDENGNIYQVPTDISYEKAYNLAIDNKGKIVIVWPGQWRTDAFEVDTLEDFGKAHGIVKEDLPVEIIGFRLSPYGESSNRSRCYDVFYRYLGEGDAPSNLYYKIQNMMTEKFGWDIATSKGCGGGWSSSGIHDAYMYVKNEHRQSWGEIPEK